MMQRLLFFLLLLLLSQQVPAQEWKLVWSDEFNAEGRPDESTWNFEQGFVRNH